MAERNEHLAVIMLEQIPAAQEFEVWPPHITLVPWFPCDDGRKLDKLLDKISANHKLFIAKAGKIEEWGKKDKFTIQKIEDKGELHRLHWDVFRNLEKSGFPIHQKEFLGEKYTPHITLRNHLQKGNAMERGEEILISNFSLVRQVRLKKSGRMIKSLVKDYALSG